MKILSGTSNPILSQSIAQTLKIPVIDCEIAQFSNGETRVWVKDDVKGEHVCLVQSLTQPVDEHIMEALLIIDALERLGAKYVTLTIPWMGYSLQDKVFRKGEPISAKVVANIFSQSYVKRVQLMDLHNDSIPGFFSVPTDYLSAMDIFVQHIKKQYDLKQTIIASPDFGGLKRARVLAQKLKVPLVNIDKTRDLADGQVRAQELHGDVKGKSVIVFDDVIVSGGTIVESAKIIKQNQAKQAIFMASHGLLTGNALEKIEQSEVDQVIITNSINQDQANDHDKMKILDVAPAIAQSLARFV